MRDVLEGIVVALTAMTLGAGVVIAVGRWSVKHLVLPWLEAHFVTPAKEAARNSAETRRQMTVNHHVSDPPTLLDTVHTVRNDVADVREDLAEARQAFALAGGMFEGHITASEEDRAALWSAVSRLEDVTTSLASSIDTHTKDPT